jgi:nucleotidyltransferase/DNA polymerase involved in DNA repair
MIEPQPPVPQIIAHVDADCFYVACEMLKDPSLRGRPVGVLSSQDACVVSKSYEAKNRGIKTGMPRWTAEKLCPGIVLIPADFYFYEQISRKMFGVLRELSPLVEVYSIDEGFLRLDHVHEYSQKSYQEIGEIIRKSILKYTGISSSVGVSVTKTIAKMASEKNKPGGVTAVYQEDIVDFLSSCKAEEIWGVGRNRVSLLNKYGITTSYDFYKSDKDFIKRLLHKPGLDLWYELHSRPVMPVISGSQLPKSISRTSSLGRILDKGSTTRIKDQVWALLSYHVFKAMSSMVSNGQIMRRVIFYLKIKDKPTIGKEITLERHTNNYAWIVTMIRKEFDTLFVNDEDYRKCGIVLSDLILENQRQGDVFGNYVKDGKQKQINQAIAKINKRYGRGMVMPGSTGQVHKTKRRHWRVEEGILECS